MDDPYRSAELTPPRKPPIDWGAVAARIVAWPFRALTWLLFLVLELALFSSPFWAGALAWTCTAEGSDSATGNVILAVVLTTGGASLVFTGARDWGWRPLTWRAYQAIARAARRPVRRE